MTSDSRTANDLNVIQDLIAISADRLEGLRTQCATSATLTQQEIRSLETKLLRMFSELLLKKERLNERIPASGLHTTTGNELKQWLRVVGLSQESLSACLAAHSTLEQLLEQNDDELRCLITNNPNYREEEIRRLTKAMQNLKNCKELLNSDSESGTIDQESKENLLESLFWDSWDRHHQHHNHHHRGSVGNIGITASPRTQRVLMKQARNFGSSVHQLPHNDNSCRSITDDSTSLQGSTLTPTLTPSPPSSPFTLPHTNYAFSSACSSLNGTPIRGKPAGTPPPLKKHQTLINNCNYPLTPIHCGVSIPTSSHQTALDKINLQFSHTKSNESSQFHSHDTSCHTAAHSPPSLKSAAAATIVVGSTNNATGIRSRIHVADPSADTYSTASSDIFVDCSNNSNSNNLQVPRSPCTPLVTLGMGHTISHRFTKVFKMMASCDLCQKQMFFGLKCKECKYRCHKDCELNVPPSCGLPREFVDEFKKTLQDQVGFHPPTSLSGHANNNQSSVNTSPNLNTLGKNRTAKRLNKPNQIVNAESSSPGSSCNSSSPSSPALFNMHHQQQHISTLASNTCVAGVNCTPNSAYGANIMSSSAGGSSSTSSNMLSTPSSFHKNSIQFNFPDVTVTPNCNTLENNAANATQTLFTTQSSNKELDATITTNIQNYNDANATTTTIAGKSEQNAGHTAASGNCNSMTCSITSSTSTSNPARSGSSTAVIMNMVSTHSGTFYPRKLSSAGVDKRGPSTELTDTHKSNDSDKTVSLSESTSASTDSDRTPVRLDSTEDADSGHWPRQNSLSAKEWDIPYGDLLLLEQIGKGRFGTVHRALWHGPVAVKLLKEDYLHDERMLEAFRLEVANFKKTRHENLVLFMGACMNPPFLAIVTSLCKGNTLYTYIHIRRDKFTINKTTLVAQQISQGMGYLHARGIVHKDLRTKNIFLENGKVIITDFGLFSSTKLNYCDMLGLCVPNGWLCYMSPELMRALLPTKPSEEVLPFTRTSDVYSFGTVWYELLCGEFPFRMQPPESIIWQVGRGMKQTLANLHTSRDVKDILMLCWSFQADDRPDFQKLLNLLEKLPKKRLARSPSHPVQFTSRSAESVF